MARFSCQSGGKIQPGICQSDREVEKRVQIGLNPGQGRHAAFLAADSTSPYMHNIRSDGYHSASLLARFEQAHPHNRRGNILQYWQISSQLIVGDMDAVAVPLDLFVLDKSLEDVVAKGFPYESALLSELDCLHETSR